MEDIPIEIHSKKLMEWLISRRHCKRDWSENALTIRKKIQNAIHDMPANEEIVKLLSGSYINYFHCLRIVDILKETESGSKNIFGWYSSQRMKDWAEVVKLYERDNVYLAEVSQMLTRNVYYEVPALKEMISRCSQTIEDSEKDEAKCVKNARVMKENYRAACAELGIKGDNLTKELRETVRELVPLLENLALRMKNVKDACEFYHAFLGYSLNRRKNTAQQITPLLNCLIDKGNVTVYEWRYGTPPIRIEDPAENDQKDSLENDNKEIDFGEEGGINFGDDEGIDFEDSVDTPVVDSDNIVGISKDENTKADGNGVATKENALSILEYTKTRNEIMNELYELESFMELRLMEMKLEENFLSMIQFESAPVIVQRQTSESVTAMRAAIKECLLAMDSPKIQHFLLIKSSPKYLNRLLDPLKHKLRQAEKMANSQPSFAEIRKRALAEQTSIRPKLELLIQKTKDLQKEVEAAISKKYNGRRINIIGDINAGDFAVKANK